MSKRQVVIDLVSSEEDNQEGQEETKKDEDKQEGQEEAKEADGKQEDQEEAKEKDEQEATAPKRQRLDCDDPDLSPCFPDERDL